MNEWYDASQGELAQIIAITAAVVGVILNLAVFLAQAVVWPDGHPDFFAIAMAVAAFLVMQRYRIEIHWLVAGGAAAGLLYRFVF